MKTSTRSGPKPDDLLRATANWTVASRWLLALGVGYTLYFAAGLLIPMAIAVLLSILLFPLIRLLASWHIPKSLSAILVIGTLVSSVALTISALSSPAEKWLNEAPRSIRQLQELVHPAKGSLEDIQALADEVDELTTVQAKKKNTQAVVVQAPSMLEGFMGGLPTITASVTVIVFMTFFLLITGEDLVRKTVRCGRTFGERRRIITISRCIQAELSGYLAMVTIINIMLGAATALAMYLLDVPNPVLWGALVALFNFAPYVGALASLLMLGLVGLTTFDALADALLVPSVFLLLTTLEGQLITPSMLGKRMALSPLVLFVSVVVWGWLWGVAGALIAVPLVACLKAVCEHYPPLRYVGTFLTREGDGPECPQTDETGSAQINQQSSGREQATEGA